MPLKEEVVSLASSLGADLVGVAPASVHTNYLEEARGRIQETGATERDFMLPEDAMTFFETLADVRNALPSAKSVILLGVYAFDGDDDYRASMRELRGKTAKIYNYYPVVRQIAEQLVAFIEDAGYHAVQGQQIPLKHAAHELGLGAYGWNGVLLTKDFGSYVALRAVATDAELEPDALERYVTPCEDCGRCLNACPTGALYAPYKVNPAQCLNPVTRKLDRIPAELREKMGNWVCGCDVCQEVCPANQDLEPRVRDPRAGFDPAHHSSHRDLDGLARCPDLTRLLEDDRADVIRRNAIIALANIGTEEALAVLQRHRRTDSGKFAEYFAWAIEWVTKSMEPRSQVDAGGA